MQRECGRRGPERLGELGRRPVLLPGGRARLPRLSSDNDLEGQLGAGGDFAWAYVIAPEMGHHAQSQLGTSDEVRSLQRERPDEANELSVRLELQADCYAGVWGNTVFRQGDPSAATSST